MLSLSSQQVVGGFNRKEARAYAHIRETNYAWVYGLISHFTNDSPDTEDFVCEVFVRLYESEARFGNKKKIQDYLYLTAKSISLNHNKKQELIQSKSEDIKRIYAQELDDSREADEALASFKERVYKIANDFPRQMQAVFVLWLKEDLTNSEIAERLEITEKTVANQKSKAITKLKFEISKKGGRDLFMLNLIL